ncbi:MAG: hypothetical protein HZB40_20030 [Rhodocyclales bacterium]|nr:hypothetical protein [Rhodocyclales bacterium]
MFAFVKTLLRKEPEFDELSFEEIHERIARLQPRRDELKSLLARADADESARHRSEAWRAQMKARLLEADTKRDLAQATRIEQELAEASKRREKIEAGARALVEELNGIEDQIELLTRALDKLSR